MLPHSAFDAYPQSQPNGHSNGQSHKRRRTFTETEGVERSFTGGGGRVVRECPHCGRTFKRTEHLERHVRTHTKEKPFVCHCGAAFARKDLLVRHRRISLHEGISPTETSPTTQAAEADLAAAVSLSGLSTDPWANQQIQPGTLPLQLDGRDGRNVDNRTQYPQELLSPRLFGAGEPPCTEDMSCQVLGDSIQFDPHFREFANFLDGVGLPAEWSPYFNGPEKENENEVIESELRQFVSESPSPRPRQRAGTPFSSWLPSAPTGNRITNYASENNPRAVDPETQRFKITDEQRAGLKACLDSFSDVLDPAFRMPSRHALTRYITSWFEGFHSHMPFIHCRTWNVLDHSLELILGIASIGAQYCFEHSCSERLFFAGKAILMERLRKSLDSLGPRMSSYLNLNTPTLHRRQGTDISPTDPTETVRALIALMGYATWEPKASMVREAFALQGLLAQVLRDIGLEEDDEMADDTPPPASAHRNAAHNNWLAWVEQESRRRSKLIAFSFLHTHSIAYNVYPVLLSNEVKLRLPCSTREWKAGSAAQWQAATKEIKKQQLYFQDALSLLLRNKNGAVPLDPIPTPLGNYLLLHGLLQRIHIVRELSLPVSSDIAALPTEEVDKLERGLRSWTTGWQQAAESSLDPNNENGPIPFTSSSLLALAYVRIHLNLGPYRQLETRDTSCIAKALSRSPCVERSDGVIAALLYAVHMLSIPVRLGIDRVARSQAFFWSVRHTLSSLDCSILLSKWLGKLGETMASAPLTDSEDRILHWVRSIVEEANDVVDFEDEEEPPGDLREPRQLGLAVLKIWAHFFKRNTQWPFINIIGTGLEKYREILIRNSS
ncbi:unnamed protein product [Clonostachys rhizophaga]|uniref:C2H2-type domain-containing protein n=1 Tax=Clonostachys rhizophaga TaxID=160324 RepID=A0A9N9W674_9HYPO|nr:unnamed protein product [Clonostachys rhizophaga]